MHHATDQARARQPELLLPRTGKAVYAEEGGIQAETFRGGWHQEVPLGPLNLAPELQEAWDAYISQVDADEADLDVAAFLEGVDHPDWVAFEINSIGMACDRGLGNHVDRARPPLQELSAASSQQI